MQVQAIPQPPVIPDTHQFTVLGQTITIRTIDLGEQAAIALVEAYTNALQDLINAPRAEVPA